MNIKNILKKSKVGIFPGSFDPLHKGHTNIMELALTQLGLEKIYLLPIINPRKNQTSITTRVRLLKKVVQNNKRIKILQYKKLDYWHYIDFALIKKYPNHQFYRLMGETCYNAYREVGVPPLRDEPDCLLDILKTQYVVIMPNPPTNHSIRNVNLPMRYRKKIIVLRIPNDYQNIKISSVSQKIKIYPFLGLKEQKYNNYYDLRQEKVVKFRSWEKKYWTNAGLKIGLAHGTFDMVHEGHISLWELAKEQFGLDAVFVWPSKIPYHKPNAKSFLERFAALKEKLALHPFIHLLVAPSTNFFFNNKNIDSVEKILNMHERVVDWLVSNLPTSTTYYRLFGSDSINDYLCCFQKSSKFNPLKTMLHKGNVAVLERLGFPLPDSLPEGIYKLNHTTESKYYYGLSGSLLIELEKKFGNLLVGEVNSKHLPQNLQDKNSKLFDALSGKVGYEYSRIGIHKNYSHREDIQYVHKMSTECYFRPVKFVITKDSRIWADIAIGHLPA